MDISKQFFLKTKDSDKFTKPPPKKKRILMPNVLAKSQLHNLYLACKAFWAKNSKEKCTLEVAQRSTYEFELSPDVEVKVLKFLERNFEAHARTKKGDGLAWKITSKGFIDKVK